MRVPYLSVCLFIVNQVVPTSAQDINAGILSDELNKVADSVGWSFIQVEITIDFTAHYIVHS